MCLLSEMVADALRVRFLLVDVFVITDFILISCLMIGVLCACEIMHYDFTLYDLISGSHDKTH